MCGSCGVDDTPTVRVYERKSRWAIGDRLPILKRRSGQRQPELRTAAKTHP
jgi:hypothetical protein